MKLEEALEIIDRKERGFMVSFEVRDGNLLRSDYFPEKHNGESLIPTEEEAWQLAGKFAKAAGNEVVNIYVTDYRFSPVSGYRNKMLRVY